ncbi:MAG: hypothetical protein O7F73_02825 [Gammaproteobacteria bacterium]|nr:hypothetical protein [Gammaproteobacteria bacterium]
MNQLIYNFAAWLDSHRWSTLLHESFYMYNWVETTHVLTLMLSLGMLFLVDLRLLGYAFPDVPASAVAGRLKLPMLVGFTLMVVTGLLLFYAIPVRSAQSVWFRIKFLLLIAAAINAFLFHRRMRESVAAWDTDQRAPRRLRAAAALSIIFWVLIVICGRLIAYNWFDCEYDQPAFVSAVAGCIAGQELY